MNARFLASEELRTIVLSITWGMGYDVSDEFLVWPGFIGRITTHHKLPDSTKL